MSAPDDPGDPYVRFALIATELPCRSYPPLGAMRRHWPVIYSITSSASCCKCRGTLRPSAFAVLRLITSSYLVGACTGRSAGFAPLRRRSIYSAALVYWSITSNPIGHQTTTRRKVTILIDRRHSVACCQLDSQLPMSYQKDVRQIDEAAVRVTGDCYNCTLNLRNVTHAGGLHLYADRWGSSLGEMQEVRSATGGRRRIEHEGDTREAGHDL